MNRFPATKTLVLAPHTDDGELGCGATISRLIREGAEVTYVAFSICEESVPDGFPSDILASEVLDATRALGIPADNVHVHRFPVRHFPSHRQEILELLVRMKRELNPDCVFVPTSHDCHQDHQVISQEGRRAFKGSASILGYELPWNQMVSDTTMLVSVDDSDIERKCAAFSAYKSQSFRPYDIKTIRSLAKLRGIQMGCPAAEAYEVIRWIVS